MCQVKRRIQLGHYEPCFLYLNSPVGLGGPRGLSGPSLLKGAFFATFPFPQIKTKVSSINEMEMKQRTDLPVSRFSDFHIYWSCNPRQTRYLAGKFEISLRLHSPCFPSPESETIKSFHHIAIFFNFNSILSYLYPNIQQYLINTSISYLIFQQQKIILSNIS